MGELNKKGPGILNIVLLILPFVILIVLGVTLTREPDRQKKSVSEPKNESVNSLFCSGSDWGRVDSMNLSPEEKARLKSEMFRIEIEICYMTGTPMFSSNVPMDAYLAAVEKFYSDKANWDVPLFFAMKMTDMAAKGAPVSALQTYRSAFMGKLKTAKLIK